MVNKLRHISIFVKSQSISEYALSEVEIHLYICSTRNSIQFTWTFKSIIPVRIQECPMYSAILNINSELIIYIHIFMINVLWSIMISFSYSMNGNGSLFYIRNVQRMLSWIQISECILKTSFKLEYNLSCGKRISNSSNIFIIIHIFKYIL